MRRLVSILFLSLLLLQAIPVLHFFSSNRAAFYSLIDEEKPVEKSGIEKKEYSQPLAFFESGFDAGKTVRSVFLPYLLLPYSSPTLDALTPPPNQ